MARSSASRRDHSQIVEELEALTAFESGEETKVVKGQKVLEKLEGVEVLSKSEYGEYGVILWKRPKGDFIEFGTHEYRVDNSDAWYTGHYFGTSGDTNEADAKLAAQKDFDDRAAKLSGSNRKEARTMRGRKRVEKKGLEVRGAKGVDSTKVDKKLGKGGDSPEDPKQHLGNPDKPKAPSFKKDPDPQSSSKSAPKLKYFAAIIDGKEIERVRAKNKADAKVELTKSMSISKTRRQFLRLWVSQGSKIVPADGDRAIGWERKESKRPSPARRRKVEGKSTTVAVDCGSKRGAAMAVRVLEGKAKIKSATAEANTVNVDVQAGQDDALKLVLDILGDEGFDLEPGFEPDFEPAPEPEVDLDVSIDDDFSDEDFEGFEGKVRGAKVVAEGDPQTTKERISALSALMSESLTTESIDFSSTDLYEKLIGWAEKLDDIIDNYFV